MHFKVNTKAVAGKVRRLFSRHKMTNREPGGNNKREESVANTGETELDWLSEKDCEKLEIKAIKGKKAS